MATGQIGDRRDPAFIRQVQPIIETFARYFRPEIRGFDRLPANGPFLIVGNHSGGQNPPDLPILWSQWWRERGVEDPLYSLFHSTFIGLPLAGAFVSKLGGLEAGHAAAEAVLHRDGIVVVFPGGDHEVFRPWRERFQIDFAGRNGFIRLALRARVPVVPMTSCGTHESLVVLSRGEQMAKRLHIDTLLRTKVWPFVLGPPWGIAPPGLPTIPLPAKVTVELGEPLRWNDEHGAAAADDDKLVGALYDEITETMQATMDRLAAMRRWPVLG
jgi:1-acyl-sn-glycerol-3-phosphate acyltransferase